MFDHLIPCRHFSKWVVWVPTGCNYLHLDGLTSQLSHEAHALISIKLCKNLDIYLVTAFTPQAVMAVPYTFVYSSNLRLLPGLIKKNLNEKACSYCSQLFKCGKRWLQLI